MPKISAGLLLYRRTATGIEVLIAHPGGPMWAHRDTGAWSLPKGLVDDGEEDLLAVARREFAEETGHVAPAVTPLPLGETRLRSGKVVHAWAIEGDLDPATAVSNVRRRVAAGIRPRRAGARGGSRRLVRAGRGAAAPEPVAGGVRRSPDRPSPPVDELV